MDAFSPSAVVRQRKMKRVAKTFFALAVMTVATPAMLGFFGIITELPLGLMVAFLMVIGIVIQARSDPVFAKTSAKQK